MNKVVVSYTAVVDKTLEISDELYEQLKNWDSLDDVSVPYWALLAEFEKQGMCPGIYISDMNSVEDAETEEMLFEY